MAAYTLTTSKVAYIGQAFIYIFRSKKTATLCVFALGWASYPEWIHWIVLTEMPELIRAHFATDITSCYHCVNKALRWTVFQHDYHAEILFKIAVQGLWTVPFRGKQQIYRTKKEVMRVDEYYWFLRIFYIMKKSHHLIKKRGVREVKARVTF